MSRVPTASSRVSRVSTSQPGETATVRFTVDPTALAYYDEAMRLVVEPGTARVMVGGLEQPVTVTGAEREIAPNDRRPTIVEIDV